MLVVICFSAEGAAALRVLFFLYLLAQRISLSACACLCACKCVQVYGCMRVSLRICVRVIARVCVCRFVQIALIVTVGDVRCLRFLNCSFIA